MPKTIEAITLLVLTFLNSGKKLYSDHVVDAGNECYMETNTRCEEIIDDYGDQMIVGAFGSDGFDVMLIDADSDDIGAAACQKL